MRAIHWSVPFAYAVTLLAPHLAAQAPPTPAPSLPVREVTVFKDGHAYVVREAPLAANATEVVLTELPRPVLGTFWPYATGGARLVAAKSGHETLPREHAATDLRQIARANVGKDVVVVTADKERVEGKLLGVPSRSTPPTDDGDLLLLQTASGTRALPLAQVRDLEVRGEFTSTVRSDEAHDRLVLQVAGGGPEAKVGMMYVEQGLRWIPAYRIEIDGAGKATVQFEATLQNDLIDLAGATVNLVIGVPKFEFAGMVDPISLQEEIAHVAATMGRQNLSNLMSNAIMTQAAGYVQTADAGGDAEPTVVGGAGAEDLFVFTIRDITLKKGERLALPIATYALGYRDVYRLDVPFAPPMEVRQNLQSERVLELARQLAAPKARHVLRLQNGEEAPLTTAPALVLSQGRVLAQGRMSYTPKGRESDLEINVAIDVGVDIDEHETKREPGPFRFGDENFARVDVAGTIALHNHKQVPVEIEVSRRSLGLADDVGQDGSKRQLDLVQLQGDGQPAWWGWWSWPYWWFARNGFAEFRWHVTLAPGAATSLEASWHYFWR